MKPVIRKLVTALMLVPLAIVLVALAVANRHMVAVSFDPFDDVQPAFSVSLPLFALILIVLIGGVIVGGTAAWLGQGRRRARVRRFEVEARSLRQENERLQRGAAMAERPQSPLPAVDTPRFTRRPPA